MARGARIIGELRGVQDFSRALAGATADVQARASAACRETAMAISQRAKSLAPRDKGDLVAAIAFEGKGLKYRVGIKDGDVASRGGTNTAHRNPWVYGVWYEFGFRTRNIATPTGGFIRPAADAEDTAHQRRLENAINSGLAAAA